MSDAEIIATGPIAPLAMDILKPFGKITIAQDTSDESLISLMTEAQALVVRGVVPISARVIHSAQRLRVIGRTGAGYSNVDIAAATERKIPVVYTPGANDRAVAEASVALMLALAKRIVYWDRQLKAGHWQSRFESANDGLDGAVLGIVGFGRIGQMLAQLVRPFNMTVLAHDPFAGLDAAESLSVTLTDLDDLLQRADFICLHAALTDETRSLINRARLQCIKPGAYLVNLARGELIENLDILYEALTDGRLSGVGLDVFAPEPPDVSHPIFKMPNCLTAPHALAQTHGVMTNIFKSVAEDMAAVLTGRRPRCIVNPEVFS